MKLYHYTSRLHLPLIRRDGLKTTDSNLAMSVAEPGVVWFMKNPDPKLVHGNPMLRSIADKTEFRLRVEPEDAVRWIEWASEQEGFDPMWAAVLSEAGNNTMKEWWVVPRPMAWEEITQVAWWNGKKYEPQDDKAPMMRALTEAAERIKVIEDEHE